MKNILYTILTIFVFLLLGIQFAFSQNSYVVIEAQYDSWGPQESQFYITDGVGDTIYHNQPTQPYEYILDTLFLDAQTVNAILLDTYGDGWQDTGTQGYFRAWNGCQDTIVEFICSQTNYFATEIITFNLGPCLPNGPPGPPPPCLPATVIINLDQYQSETSWEITDTLGIVLASGSGYGSQPDYGTVIESVCLPQTQLNFTIFDSYGDGLNGGLWQGQDGSYFVKQCNDTLVFGTDPAFGNDSTHIFVSDTCPPILGCTDDDYVEWNPFATVDDGSCQTLKIFGCIDSTMFNYDPNANTMDLIPNCEFTLILHDLMGNGWVGSNLELLLPDTTYVFTHLGGFNEEHQFTIDAPDPAAFRFNITPQASLTTIECGFTLINPEGDTLISVQPPFIQPLFPYSFITNCGNTCIEKVFGCTDTFAVNYDSLANTDDNSCYYTPGCMNSSYLEYYTQGFTADHDDGTCTTLAVWGCMDSTAFNYDPLANIDNGGSIPVVTGCMDAFAFNYNPLANTPDTCIPYIYGCTNPLAFNYDSLANTDDGSCIAIVYGCTDSTMFNFIPSANIDDGSCIPYIFGCMDASMWNYNPNANTDNGSCIPFIYGCTDSVMFNYDPLANTDNGNCIPYIYGCTDPSMLNYDPQANTENFSCIPYIYGCTDSTAFNYNPLANTDNGSCITVVEGCMDQAAYTYNALANVNDSSACFYDAGCITGPGNPYWLNDECYAWVIEVDEYCCENEWDNICQLTYDYCQDGWTGSLPPARIPGEQIIIYPNPTKDIINIVGNEFSIKVYDTKGKLIIKEFNPKTIDFSNYSPGIYTLQILYRNNLITRKIIKN